MTCIRLHEFTKHYAEPEIEIGKPYPTPCKHKGIIVWISQDRKTIAVKCTEKHTIYKTLWNKTTRKTQHPTYIIKVAENDIHQQSEK